jgi:hypothetical protein
MASASFSSPARSFTSAVFIVKKQCYIPGG